MAIKKSELLSHLWKSGDELRDGMDASQHKDYATPLPELMREVADISARVDEHLKRRGFVP